MEKCKTVYRFGARMMLIPLILVNVLPIFTHSSAAVTPIKDQIGIDEKLGQMVPLDITLNDEEGKPVVLKDIVGDKPFILALAYYHCPGICDSLLTGMAEVMDTVQLEPGKDFHAITISFDPEDNPATALQKKSTYYTSMKRKIGDDGWKFLTGKPEDIAKITKAVGFQYKKVEGGYYLHSAAIMAVSPAGKISRYLYGVTYLPFDVQMALTEASQGKTGPTINKLLLYCFSYEPSGRRYAFNVLRIGGISTLLFGLCFLGWVLVKTKKARKDLGENQEVNQNG